MADLRSILRAEGKALPYHEFFAPGGAPISTYIPGGNSPRDRPLLSQREASRHLQSYGGDQAIDWVYDAANLYADTAAGAPYHFERAGEAFYSPDDPKKPKDGKVVDARLARLIAAPNPFMDYHELLQLIVIDLLLVGNAYLMKWRPNAQGQPLALYRMSPRHVKVKGGDYGVEAYQYQPDGVPEPVTFGIEDVVHLKRPNPHSLYYGLGIIKGGGRPFDLELALTDSQASYFENKADPSMIVQSERRVPRDVFNKLRAQLRARASGTNRAGELLVLEAGLKASTLTPSARDAMFAELHDKSRDRVLSMFRVHPSLLGIPGTTGGTDKVQDIRREFDNKTMRPFLDRLQSLVTTRIVSAWDYSFHIDYRYTMPQEEAVKLSGDLGSVPGVRVDDVRRFLVEAGVLRDVSTGDTSIDETVLNLPGNNLDANGQPIVPGQGAGGFADKNLPGQAGRPPKPGNTKPFPKKGQPMPSGAAAKRSGGKALTIDEMLFLVDEIGTKAVKDNVTISVGRKLANEQRPSDPMAVARARDIDALVANMTSELSDAGHELQLALFGVAEGKAFDPAAVKRRLRSSEAWKTFAATVAGVMEKYAQQGLSSASIHNESTAEIDYEAVARELVYRRDGIRSITANFKNELIQKVAAGLKEDASRASVEQAIKESIDFWQQTKSETIALTEAVHAYNEGTLVALEAAGATEVYVEDGDDHDEPCAAANGSVWTIEHAREHRLEHPRCRRAFLPAPVVA